MEKLPFFIDGQPITDQKAKDNVEGEHRLRITCNPQRWSLLLLSCSLPRFFCSASGQHYDSALFLFYTAIPHNVRCGIHLIEISDSLVFIIYIYSLREEDE